MTRRLLATAMLLVLCGSAAVGFAQQVKRRRMGVWFDDGVPRLSYSARDLVDARVREKLDSGLPQRLVVQHFAYVSGRKAPIAATGHSCRVVFDLWQTAYRVQYTPVDGQERFHTFRDVDQVLDLCLVMRHVPLGEAEWFPSGRPFHVASLIELNPLSEQTVARIRRWLSRPGGGDGLEGNAFFGSFVSLFVNHRIGSAERILKLRSQTVRVP